MSPRTVTKSIIATLPLRWQHSIKRSWYALQMGLGRFGTPEPEYKILERLVSPGDWAIDVGANVGFYTTRLSELVGEEGRVIAFEPVPSTAELLLSNVRRLRNANVTVLNAAALDKSGLSKFTVPKSDNGLLNPYLAHISQDEGEFSVLCLTIDALDLPRRVRLVKIDAERSELSVLMGMRQLLARDKPILIVEGNERQVADLLELEGYRGERLPESPNTLFQVPY